jgi:hypothetical protein
LNPLCELAENCRNIVQSARLPYVKGEVDEADLHTTCLDRPNWLVRDDLEIPRRLMPRPIFNTFRKQCSSLVNTALWLDRSFCT